MLIITSLCVVRSFPLLLLDYLICICVGMYVYERVCECVLM